MARERKGFGCGGASSKRAGTRSGWIETVARKFSSTETVLEPLFATARSNLPSPLRSPIATEEGPLPVPKSAFGPNDPSPAPSRTETAYEPQQAVAKSSLPSPSRSPIAMERGSFPMK